MHFYRCEGPVKGNSPYGELHKRHPTLREAQGKGVSNLRQIVVEMMICTRPGPIAAGCRQAAGVLPRASQYWEARRCGSPHGLDKDLAMRWLVLAVITGSMGLAAATTAHGEHRVMMQGNDRLAIVGSDGQIEWEMPWGGIHDLHVLPGGHILVQQGAAKIAEIDPATKKVVWSYDAASQNGNAGRKVEVHAFQPLGEGRLMLAESGPARIIEIDREGRLLKAIRLKTDHPSTHSDTRLVRKLKNGHYLVAQEADGKVREYDGDGKIVWEYEVPLFGQSPKPGHGLEAFGNRLFAALRLPNGNTLIATGNGHSVIEVTHDKEVVWKIGQHDLPNIGLAWVTTLEVLPNGHYVIGNCHAGPGNPLLVEIDPTLKKVVWTFDQYERFGNAASNSQLLDVEAGAIR
jgi:outer membrane protein assembly factor BamB